MAQCLLLSGLSQKLLQVVLLVASLSVLGAKHFWEKSTGRTNRSTARFFFDSSKQLIGSAWMHVMNLFFAGMLASHSSEDSCEWYWIEIMVDTTLGVYVEFCTMRFIIGMKHWHWTPMEGLINFVQESCVRESRSEQEDAETQKVGLLNPERPEDILEMLKNVDAPRYAAQVLVWLLVVSIMKLVMLTTMVVFEPQFLGLAATVLAPFSSLPFLKLVFVMVLTPVVMDSVQFFLQDNIFLDLEEHRLVEVPPQRKEASTKRRTLMDIKEANERCKTLASDNDHLRLEVATLMAELRYQRSGYLSRIVLASFVGNNPDQRGLYRITKRMKTFHKPEFPLQFHNEDLESGRVVELDEIQADHVKANTKWAKIHRPAELANHWILLVHQGERCGKRLLAVDVTELFPGVDP